MCDYIEENGVIKERLNCSLRENLKNEFIKYVVYMCMLNGSLLSGEVKYLRDNFHIDFNQEKANMYKYKYNLIKSKFGSEIPLVFKYFVLADALLMD